MYLDLFIYLSLPLYKRFGCFVFLNGLFFYVTLNDKILHWNEIVLFRFILAHSVCWNRMWKSILSIWAIPLETLFNPRCQAFWSAFRYIHIKSYGLFTNVHVHFSCDVCWNLDCNFSFVFLSVLHLFCYRKVLKGTYTSANDNTRIRHERMKYSNWIQAGIFRYGTTEL